MEKTIEQKIIHWFAHGRTGRSSEAMAFCVAGVPASTYQMKATPSDPSDFNLCLMFLEAVPEARGKFNELAKLSEEWKVLIASWDALEKCFVDEVGAGWKDENKRAEKTYKMMKSLGL